MNNKFLTKDILFFWDKNQLLLFEGRTPWKRCKEVHLSSFNLTLVFLNFIDDIELYCFGFQDSLEGEAEVLLDPNALSEDGSVSLRTLCVSKDAKFMAYGLSSSGSDWVTINVMHVQNKNVEPHTLSWVSNLILMLIYSVLITSKFAHAN